MRKKFTPQQAKELIGTIEGLVLEGYTVSNACYKMSTQPKVLINYMSRYDYALLKGLVSAVKIINKTGSIKAACKHVGMSETGFTRRYPNLKAKAKTVREGLIRARVAYVIECLDYMEGETLASVSKITGETISIVTKAFNAKYGIGEGNKSGLKSKV